MVVDSGFDVIFDFSSRISNLTLPKYKQHNFILEFNDSGDAETIFSGQTPILPFAETNIHNVPIKEWRHLSRPTDGYKTVYEITFDIEDTNIKFTPGDTIGVLPHNDKADVNELLERLHIHSEADSVYNINVENYNKTKLPSHIPVQSTLRHVFTHCIDLRGVVKKLFLLELSQYTENVKEKKALEYLCSREGSVLYNQQVLNKKLSIVKILNIFETCNPPVSVILAHSSRLLPRPYSICNCMKYNKKDLNICFSVMTLDNNKKGLTTGLMEDKILGISNIEIAFEKMTINGSKNRNKIPIYLRKNMGFTLPDCKEKMLLICAGTGIAPFIGFLQERQYLKDNNLDSEIGDIWLYYGCRNPEVDYLYREELQRFKDKGVLSKLSMAFSRIDNGGIKYVQDAIRQDKENVSKFIQDGAVVFVCGDLVTMATQVRDTIVQALTTQLEIKQNEAEQMVTLMEKDKKYVTDVWS